MLDTEPNSSIVPLIEHFHEFTIDSPSILWTFMIMIVNYLEIDFTDKEDAEIWALIGPFNIKTLELTDSEKEVADSSLCERL